MREEMHSQKTLIDINDPSKGMKKINPEDISEDLVKLLSIRSKQSANAGNIFNKMEQYCAYVKNDLVDSEILRVPLHGILISFMKENKDILDYISDENYPYSNLHFVFELWSDEKS